MHPTQHSTIHRRPRNASEILTRCVDGLQTMAFRKLNRETRRLNLEPPDAPLLRERASKLVNEFASKTALLEAATAETRAQITTLTAALNEVASPYQLELDRLEAEAKALALAHGPEIFGEKRSLVENGYKLALTATDEVEMDSDEQTVCRIILRDLREVERRIEHADSEGDAQRVQDLQYQRLALSSLLNTKYSINKNYVKDNFDGSADWFEMFGVRVTNGESASLKKAPPPRVAKPSSQKAGKKMGGKKNRASEAGEEQEAA